MIVHCHLCGEELTESEVLGVGVWGDYVLTVEGVNGYYCTECNEVVRQYNEARLLQELTRAFSEIANRPNLIDITESRGILLENIDNLYEAITGGHLKPVRLQGKGRILCKDALSALATGDDNSLVAARGELKPRDVKVVEEFLKYQESE